MSNEAELTSKIGIIFFVLVLIINVIAQFLEKKGMSQLGGIHSFQQLFNIHTIFSIVTNPYIISGMGFAVLGLLLWLGALSTLKLSYLVPLTGLSYVVVSIISWQFLKETITPVHWAGILVIAVGVFIINQ
jgi:drug/metabolite transporter (DMT)-like permease